MSDETAVINGIEYVRKDSIRDATPAVSTEGLPYVIVRSTTASPYAGWLEKEDGTEAIVLQARRLWRWYGASTLSQLAEVGTSRPDECQFPTSVSRVRIKNVNEILECTEKARSSIAEVPTWTS